MNFIFLNKWSNPSTSQGVLRSPWVTHGSESLLTYNIFVILRCCKKIHWLLSKIRYCQNEWRKKIQYFVIFLPNVTQSLCNKSCGKMDYNEYLHSNWGLVKSQKSISVLNTANNRLFQNLQINTSFEQLSVNGSCLKKCTNWAEIQPNDL